MINLEDITLEKIMPANLLDDENVLNACKVLDAKLKDVSQASNIPALIHRIDELDEIVLDSLAWQWHVDSYDDGLSVEQKRSLVKKSILWHRTKGTKRAVQQMVDLVYAAGTIEEWFQYSGNPYYFRIRVKNAAVSPAEINRAAQLVNSAKNARSWLDEIVFEKPIDDTICISGTNGIHKTIEVSQGPFSTTEISQKASFAGVAGVYKQIDITQGI